MNLNFVSLAARVTARGITTLSLCSLALLASANPAHAVIDDCITPASDQFNDGVADGDGVAGCTANDMGVADITGVTVLDDGCVGINDTVTISGTINFDTTNPKRYDVAAYIATNGTDALDTNSNGPQCDIYIIPAPSTPEDDGDQCGDYNGGTPGVTMTIVSTTFSCVDLIINATKVAGTDGNADVQICSSYKQNSGSTGEDGCPDYTGATPGTSSKCNCEQVALVPPIPIVECTSGACCVGGQFVDAGTTCRASTGVCDPLEACTGTSGDCPADTLSATTVTCRASSGSICDVAEQCTGTSGACPANAFQPTTVTCRASNGSICDVAEQCPGNSATCPTDGFQPSTTPCRASTGVCDVVENCTGASSTCPANGFLGTTVTCRGTGGAVCDIAEVCSGTAATCPSDSFLGTTTTCRGSGGVCDIAEVCSGTAANCPSDSYFGTTTTCRGSNGVCDVAETCTGAAAACPADGFASASTTCRADAGECDVAETCTGGGAACPADGFEPGGTSCGSSSDTICDNADTCNGSGTCQPNNEPGTIVCRADAGECDVAENCNGAGSCPADTLEPNGTSCGSSSDTICDNADTCQAGSCQANNEPGTVVCRADAGQCDVAENCSAGLCPADSFEPGGTSCGSASDTICDNADTCDGSGSCQTNNEPSSVTCRADAGACDVAETCDGAGSCPSDTLEPNGTSCGNPADSICDNPDSCLAGSCVTNNESTSVTCRADAGECDVAETCDGLGSCPADTLEPNGTACGDGTDTICDNADTCSGGTCVDNNEPSSVTCRADAGECDVAETCDGNGACPSDTLEPNGTACGDGTDTICDNADTCSGGTCVDNNEPSSVTCRADAGECDVAETCDGNGACPADTLEPNGTACGDGTDTICDNADTCSGGTCVDNNEPSSVTCRADAGECDAAETCDGNGNCPADVYSPDGTACGDGTDTICDNADTCSGGTCVDNNESSSVTCRADTGECDIAETCDGNGACPADAFEASGTSCGDGTDTICTDPDTCDGSGSCEDNDALTSVTCRADAGECDVAETCDGNGACPADAYEASGTSCGDGTDTICTDPDTCDGSGSCEDNDALTSVTCRADAGECDVAETCDGNGACPADAFEASGTSCGDGTDTICSDPDTCDGSGACEDNHETITVECRGAVGQCDIAETCDGNGACPADAFEASGEPCGNPGDTICDDPDTCDGSGTCETNNEPITVECRADAGECDVPESCDGAGACPADAFEASGTSCGDGTDTICDNADTCDGSGACQDNNEASTVTCRADAGECDVPETCDGAGSCPADGFESSGTSCGSSSDTICDNADTCDGSGACQDNYELSTVTCRGDAGECDVAETCDGAGSCPADGFETDGTSCGSPDDGECDNPDSCTAGACVVNNEPSGTTCGSPTDTICDNADTCDGTGSCQDNNEPSTVECRSDAGECDVPESCDGAGSCPADVFESSGTSCGDPSNSICDAADTCDGSGTCEDNVATTTVTCRGEVTECDAPELCDGAGSCPADAFDPSGSTCGSPDDTECDNPDTCDGSGGCTTNNEPIGTTCGSGDDTICDNPDSCNATGSCVSNAEPTTVQCRGDAGQCDVPENCDGTGSCPADGLEPNGTSCEDGNLCTEGETCQLGACTGALPVTCEDNDLCTAPSCDPSIGCVYSPDVAPLEDCYHSSGGRLAISDRVVAVRDVIRWTWRRGQIIDPRDMGSPLVDTQYAVCIFDHTDDEPILITSMNVPAAAPKWKPIKKNRLKYIDSPGTFDGIRKIRMIPKTKEYRSKVQFRARGVNLVLPAPYSSTEYMDVDSKVIVQMRNSENSCWQSSFNQSQSFRNQATKYRGKYRFKGQYQDDVLMSGLEE
jgi:hypothetical protein